MGAPVEAPAPSSYDVERPTTNLVPELCGTPYSVSLEGDHQALRKAQTLEHKSPMMPSS